MRWEPTRWEPTRWERACCSASAQVPQAPPPPSEQPVESPPLRNTGKPMVTEYHCSLEDIQFAGLSCTLDDPCPTYLELSAVEAVGNRIFVAGNIHSSSATLYSVLLVSDDSGKTWREPSERVRGVGLDRIQFVDFENGWVSGEEQHPLPREPFLLATSDGGKQWRRQPIFGDSRFGSILQFWFNSRSSGSVLVDLGQSAKEGAMRCTKLPTEAIPGGCAKLTSAPSRSSTPRWRAMRTGACGQIEGRSRTISNGTRASAGKILRRFRCRSAVANRPLNHRRCRRRTSAAAH